MQWTPEQYGDLRETLGRIEEVVQSLTQKFDNLPCQKNGWPCPPKPSPYAPIIRWGPLFTGIGLMIGGIVSVLLDKMVR